MLRYCRVYNFRKQFKSVLSTESVTMFIWCSLWTTSRQVNPKNTGWSGSSTNFSPQQCRSRQVGRSWLQYQWPTTLTDVGWLAARVTCSVGRQFGRAIMRRLSRGLDDQSRECVFFASPGHREVCVSQRTDLHMAIEQAHARSLSFSCAPFWGQLCPVPLPSEF